MGRLQQNVTIKTRAWLLCGTGLILLANTSVAQDLDVQRRALQEELLLVTGNPPPSEAGEAPDGPSDRQFSLGIVDPASNMDAAWIAPLPSISGSTWLGLYNGAFYFVTPEHNILNMLEIGTGTLATLGAVGNFHFCDGKLISGPAPDEGGPVASIFDLRRRMRREAIPPAIDRDAWRDGGISPDGRFQLFTKICIDGGAGSLELSMRLYDIIRGIWVPEHIALLPLYTLPLRVYEDDDTGTEAPLVIHGGPWDLDALVPRWHRDSLLIVRAPLGLSTAAPSVSDLPPANLGLWVIDAATGEYYPLQFDSPQGGGGEWQDGKQPSLLAGDPGFTGRFDIYNDKTGYRAVPVEIHGHVQPLGEFYSILHENSGSGLRCGISVLPGGLDLYNDRNDQRQSAGHFKNTLVSPSGTRVIFRRFSHSLSDGETVPFESGSAIGWCSARELEAVPVTPAAGEVPFQTLAENAHTVPHAPLPQRLQESRSIARELRLDAVLVEPSTPDAATRDIRLSLSNKGKRTLHLPAPNAPAVLRGTLIAPSETVELVRAASAQNASAIPIELAPGATVEGIISVKIDGGGDYTVVVGYRAQDGSGVSVTIAAPPLHFNVEGPAGDSLSRHLQAIIDVQVSTALSPELIGAVLQDGFANNPDQIGAIQSKLDKVQAAHRQALGEIKLYPRQTREVLKNAITATAEVNAATAVASARLTNLYSALGEMAESADFGFLFKRLEHGYPNELNGIVEFLGAFFRRGMRPEAPFDDLLHAVRLLQVKYPEAGRNAFLAFFYRMPDSYEAEDLVRPLLEDEQHAGEARDYLLGHRAAMSLPLDEDAIALAWKCSEAIDGHVHWGLVRTLGAFYTMDPKNPVIGDLIDSLLPENRDAVHRTMPAYCNDGAAWLRHAASHPTRERLEHARIVIEELESVAHKSNGVLPTGPWAEVEKNPEAIKAFAQTLSAWADYLDRNTVELKIP